MFATTTDSKTIVMSDNVASALAGFEGGYRVSMHALPAYTFIVDAPSGEQAVKCVVALCAKERKTLKTDAATFQRRA